MSDMSEFRDPREAQYATNTSDEISLAELLHYLIASWKTITSVIAVTVALALSYLVIATPTYSTNIAYTSNIGGVDALNITPEMQYLEAQVIDKLGLRLSSYENFSRYISESNHGHESLAMLLGDSLSEEEWSARQRGFFFDNIKVVRPEAGVADQRHEMELSYPQGFSGPSFLNDYFEWTLDDYRMALVSRVERAIASTIQRNQAEMAAHQEAYAEEVDSKIARLSEADTIRLAELHDLLEAERQAVVASRQERIRVLEQAEQIAKRLGIETPTTPRDFGSQSASGNVIYAEINAQGGLPLYFMGTKALQAEREVLKANLRDEAKTAAIRDIQKQIAQLEENRTIEALREREKNTPFIDRYMELKQQNTLLRATQVITENLRLADINHWAYQPSSPDSPRTMLIMALALILGGMLGILLVALRALWKQTLAMGTR